MVVLYMCVHKSKGIYVRMSASRFKKQFKFNFSVLPCCKMISKKRTQDPIRSDICRSAKLKSGVVLFVGMFSWVESDVLHFHFIHLILNLYKMSIVKILHALKDNVHVDFPILILNESIHCLFLGTCTLNCFFTLKNSCLLYFLVKT
jgi:hypothetical protein